MKRHVLPHAALTLALCLLLSNCGKESATPASAPVAEKTVPPAPPAPAAAPAAAADGVDPLFSTPTVEINGFGSDEPVIRADEPRRGVIHIAPKDMPRMTAAHWEQFDCTSLAIKRWGRYEVRVTYTLRPVLHPPCSFTSPRP